MQGMSHVPHHVVTDHAGQHEHGEVGQELGRCHIAYPAETDEAGGAQPVFELGRLLRLLGHGRIV